MGNENETNATVFLVDPPVAATPLDYSCIVVFYGPGLGKRYFLDRPEQTLGRSDTADIQLDDEGISRLHASLVVKGQRVILHDLGSTNGTYVNDVRVKECEVEDGDMIRIGQTVFKYLSALNAEGKHYEDIYRLTITDALTGAFNQSYFLDALKRELSRAHRHDRMLSLVFFDIDHFKAINDDFGHLAGDYVLQALVSIIAVRLREADILARYGGDELALILPETDAEGARRIAEKLRRLVEQHPFAFANNPIRITISLGVRTTNCGVNKPDHMRFIADADANLYKAKRGGRNRVYG